MGLKVGDKFPASALKTCGVSGKKAVVFFYGADDAPSCKKEIAGFDGALDEFKKAGFTVVGVRNEKGVKDTDSAVKLVVDEGDAMRKEIGIAPDLFGLLGGRETYVLDNKGQIASVFNDQFGPDKHVSTALEAAEQLQPEAKGGFEFPKFR
jgi:peroxiredoxin Q/BCP